MEEPVAGGVDGHVPLEGQEGVESAAEHHQLATHHLDGEAAGGGVDTHGQQQHQQGVHLGQTGQGLEEGELAVRDSQVHCPCHP